MLSGAISTPGKMAPYQGGKSLAPVARKLGETCQTYHGAPDRATRGLSP
jgi:hypothetical protein